MGWVGLGWVGLGWVGLRAPTTGTALHLAPTRACACAEARSVARRERRNAAALHCIAVGPAGVYGTAGLCSADRRRRPVRAYIMARGTENAASRQAHAARKGPLDLAAYAVRLGLCSYRTGRHFEVCDRCTTRSVTANGAVRSHGVHDTAARCHRAVRPLQLLHPGRRVAARDVHRGAARHSSPTHRQTQAAMRPRACVHERGECGTQSRAPPPVSSAVGDTCT